MENIKNYRVDKYIIPKKLTSGNFSSSFNKPIGFLFIDGAHDYVSVRQDFESLFPRVADQGIVAIHDSWHLQCVGPGLFSALKLLTSTHIKNPGMADTITYFQKVGQNTFFEKVINTSFIFYRLIFGLPGYIKLKKQGSLRI